VNPEDLRANACHITAAELSYCCGSLAYVTRLADNRARVLVRSSGGRWMNRRTRLNCLANFRFKTISYSGPLKNQIGVAMTDQFFTETDLEALALRDAGSSPSLASFDSTKLTQSAKRDVIKSRRGDHSPFCTIPNVLTRSLISSP
jgi:hypothetical protein